MALWHKVDWRAPATASLSGAGLGDAGIPLVPRWANVGVGGAGMTGRPANMDVVRADMGEVRSRQGLRGERH